VTKLVPFGAFVRVAPGIEGLVHISELSEQHVDSPESVLSVGDDVRVKVIEIDVARRRISLSMRQVGGAMPAVAEAEIQAEEEAEVRPVAGPVEAEATTAVEEAPAEALTEAEAEVEAVSPSAAEAVPEQPRETAPEQPAEVAPEKEEEEDVSLESILEDLKRREGRSE
jgi:small subunit ribosomal protein S1